MKVWVAYVVEEMEDPRFSRGTIVPYFEPKPYTEPDGIPKVLFLANVTTGRIWKAAKVVGLGSFSFEDEDDMRRRLVKEVKRRLKEIAPEEYREVN